MASAWGASWGRAWGNAWGAIATGLQLPPPGAGFGAAPICRPASATRRGIRPDDMPGQRPLLAASARPCASDGQRIQAAPGLRRAVEDSDRIVQNQGTRPASAGTRRPH